MVVTFSMDTLNGLCSADQLELLDCIDRLRLQGIDHLISLPQIIVCGDQSSGKSSVLEAISGVPFPVKGNLCTRFPTELVLRRAPEKSVKVSIVPHNTLDDVSKQPPSSGGGGGSSSFAGTLDGFDGFPALVEQAKTAMGITLQGQGQGFSKDLLRVEIAGPDRPHLTIVDLPGLVHTATQAQSAADVQLVQDVVRHYMRQPRSVILAVVSAKNDFANQIVLKLARSLDPAGARTLGVITKPDTLFAGSASERAFFGLARNEEVPFALGWHVLRNLDSEKEEAAARLLHRRNAEEAAFFQEHGAWREQLPESALGIAALRTRLSDVLLRQIATELPSLITEIEDGLADCRARLANLGVPRRTPDEQRGYLLQVGQAFQALVTTAVGGLYLDPFFARAESDEGKTQRVRAVVQNLNQDFANDMATSGNRRLVTQPGDAVPSGEKKSSTKASEAPTHLSRDAFLDHVEVIMSRTRGRELPGSVNPMVVTELFLEQSAPWEKIVDRHTKRVWEASKRFLTAVVRHVGERGVQDNIIREIVEPAMAALLASVNAKTAELLNPHRHIHPITYNKDYTDAIRGTIGYEERKARYGEVVKHYFGVTNLNQQHHLNRYETLANLVEKLANEMGDDRRPDAAAALDCMIAYYEIARKRFVDDVAVQVIEEKLLSALPDILSPVSVFKMDPDVVSRVAGESQQSRRQREELTKQIQVLENGSATCNRFVHFKYDDEASPEPVNSPVVSETDGYPNPLRRLFGTPPEESCDPADGMIETGLEVKYRSKKNKKKKARMSQPEWEP